MRPSIDWFLPRPGPKERIRTYFKIDGVTSRIHISFIILLNGISGAIEIFGFLVFILSEHDPR